VARHRILIAIARLMLTLGLALVAVLPARADTVTLLADEWFPYNGKPGAKHEGYMIDIARRIARDAGRDLDYLTIDWESAVARVRVGEADCAVAPTRVDGAGLALTSEPLGRSINTFFVATDSTWRYDGVASLPAVKLGVAAGYSYGDALDAYLAAPGGKGVFYIRGSRRALANLFSRLVSGRVDAVLDDQLVGQELIHYLGLRGRVQIAGRTPDTVDLFMGCTPNARGRELAALFSTGVRHLRETGELRTLMATYELSDWLEVR
jgi:polar amino acid transport system substrate-binding protein